MSADTIATIISVFKDFGFPALMAGVLVYLLWVTLQQLRTAVWETNKNLERQNERIETQNQRIIEQNDLILAILNRQTTLLERQNDLLHFVVSAPWKLRVSGGVDDRPAASTHKD